MIKEVRIGRSDIPLIKNTLKAGGAGYNSLALSFSEELKREKSMADLISIVELVLDELDVDARFPYPIYIIDPEANILGKRVQVLKTIDEAPKFIREVNHLNRENDLIWDRRCEIVKSKIRSGSFDEAIKKINNQRQIRKDLNDEIQLYAHYSRLLDLFENKER